MGTRSGDVVSSVMFEDHPHAYGDKFTHAQTAICGDRIIPTRMGTRYIYRFAPHVLKDHPHAYGDK